MSFASLLSISAASLADPPASSVLVPAVSWVQDTLTGTLATIVAIIAVASVGLAMLSGRIDLRRGATVLLGCFILFGASVIANGLRSVGDNIGADGAAEDVVPQLPSATPPPVAPPSPGYFDPYAGASVPQR